MRKLDPSNNDLMVVTLFKGDELKHGIVYKGEEALINIFDAYLDGEDERDIDIRFFKVAEKTYANTGEHMLLSTLYRTRALQMGLSWEGQVEITRIIDEKQARGETPTGGEYFRQMREFEEMTFLDETSELVARCPYIEELNEAFRKVVSWNEDIELCLSYLEVEEELDGKEYAKALITELEKHW